MALSTVSLEDVARGPDARVDPHYYGLFSHVERFVLGLDAFPLFGEHVRTVENGVNLPQSSYEVDGEAESAEYLYASVGAFSQFALQPDRCEVLKSPSLYRYDLDLAQAAATSAEVLITRSGTPGIAWPAALATDVAPIIPSGFTIRAECAEGVSPIFVCAVLNHPIWRVWTSALSTGKRQRNISQDHLKRLRMPSLSDVQIERVAESYAEAISDISRVLSSPSGIRSACDALVSEHLNIDVPRFVLDDLSVRAVQFEDCVRQGALRIDSRFHRREALNVETLLDSVECVRVRELMTGPLLKAPQPVLLNAADDADAWVVATIALQDGQVVTDELKPTTLIHAESIPDRNIAVGDVLIATDGEGSIGKAAHVRADWDLVAVPDSHVAIARLTDGELAPAVACVLNSSLGQAQIYLRTSGSTGQTQIAKDDVESLRIPVVLLNQEFGNAYSATLRRYEPRSQVVRNRVCEPSVVLTNALAESRLLGLEAKEFLAKLDGVHGHMQLLGVLRPGMF